MKLLVIIPSRKRGGVEEHALKITTAAKSQGWQVEAAFPKSNNNYSLIQDFQAANVFYRPLEIAETIVMPASSLTELLQTLTLRFQTYLEKPLHFLLTILCLIRSRPDVVLIELPWPDQGFTSLLACAMLNQPTVVIFHLIPQRLEISKPKLAIYRWMLKRNQRFIGISESNRKMIGETFKCSTDKISRIYNGIDFSQAKYSTEEQAKLRQQFRKELGLVNHSRILLTVARLDAQKAHFDLIPAIPHLIQQFPDIHFVWVGEGEQKEFLKEQLKKYDITSHVSILGYRNDIPYLLQASDLFIFPTHFEGLPFAVLEAMAHKLPIIATSVNGIPEIIDDKVNGLLVRQQDSCDLLETIRWALTNPECMKDMAFNAWMRAQDFSQSRMLKETLEELNIVSNNFQ